MLPHASNDQVSVSEGDVVRVRHLEYMGMEQCSSSTSGINPIYGYGLKNFKIVLTEPI